MAGAAGRPDGRYQRWGRPAAALAGAVDLTLDAARTGDAEGFGAGLADLARADHEQLQTLLGFATADLLERAAPDGLDGETAGNLLRGCLAESAWYPALDADALLRALVTAVGVSGEDDPDGPPPPAADAVLAHGLLLVASLLQATGTPTAQVLDAGLAEVRRAQTMEMP